jgi:CubicO group peptidase (beta-lactamase class C family)
MRRNIIIPLFGLVLVSVMLGSSLGQQIPNPQAAPTGPYGEAIQAFEKFAASQMAFDRTVGLSIAFLKDDFTWARGFGYADLENLVPAAPESAYRLASISKTFTAYAVLQLAEAGKIDLDAEIQAYVPSFPRKKWPVTVRQVLGHIGGISHYKTDAEERIREPKTTAEAMAIFQDFDLVAEPGTRYNYSSYGYNLLAAVVEAASGMAFGEYLQSRIFGPLGLESTRMDSVSALISRRVTGYRLVGGQIRRSEYVDVSSRLGGGGLRSTVLDLLKYARAVMDGKPVRPETQRLMFTSMAVRSGQLTGYGMGWFVRPLKGHFQVAHSGSQPETRTYLLLFPTERFAVAAASNFEGSSPAVYVKRLTELVLDEDLDGLAYAPDRAKRLILEACFWAFDNGLSQYAWLGRPKTVEEKDLAGAFAYFNQTLDEAALVKNFPEAKRKVTAGIHPSAGEAYTKVGAYVASALEEAYGKENLHAYRKSGPAAFFADYIKLSQSKPDFPPAFKLGDKLAALVGRWNADWTKTYTDEVRHLVVLPSTDFDELGERLNRTFGGASFRPDLMEDFAAAAAYFLDHDKPDRALRIFGLARDLYPNAPGPYVYLGRASLWAGKTAEARAYFEKAIALDNTFGEMAPMPIAAFMGQLRRAKKMDEALALGLMAVSWHPKNASLHVETGNQYAVMGRKEEAITFYKKALAIDPANEAAKKNLAKIIS